MYINKMCMTFRPCKLANHVHLDDAGEGNKINTSLALYIPELTSQLPTTEMVGDSSVLAGFEQNVNLIKSFFST